MFLLATVAGLAIAGFSSSGEFQTLQLLGTAVLGLLVAIQPTIPVFLRAAGSAFCGLVIGMDSGQAELASAALFAALVGAGLGTCLLLLSVMGIADLFRQKAWQQIGIRVIGSWITASALLVLSLSMASVEA